MILKTPLNHKDTENTEAKAAELTAKDAEIAKIENSLVSVLFAFSAVKSILCPVGCGSVVQSQCGIWDSFGEQFGRVVALRAIAEDGDDARFGAEFARGA